MKNKLYIIILFIFAFLIAEQKTTPEKLQKVATQKHNILSKNFNALRQGGMKPVMPAHWESKSLKESRGIKIPS